MKNTFKLSALLLVGVISLSSCAKDKQLEKRLEGTWNVTSLTSTDPSFAGVTVTGTHIFRDDMTGNYTYNLSFGGQSVPVSENYTWSNTDETVTLVSGGESTVFSVQTNERKRQVWTNTEDGITSTLTLDKQ